MGKASVARKIRTAPRMWSDGDVLVLIGAAANLEAHTRRFHRAFNRWNRAMLRGENQTAARTELRASAVGVCRRARAARSAEAVA
jgi:hypothetical protein